MSVCPRCGQTLPDEAKFCNLCGRSLAFAKPTPAPGPRACPNCGTLNAASMYVCGKCGKELHEASAPVPSKEVSHTPSLYDVPADIESTDLYLGDTKKSRLDKLTVAFILLIGAGLLGFVSAALTLTVDIEDQLSPAELDLVNEVLDVSQMLACCASIYIIASLSAIMAGILSLRREKFTLTVLGAAFGILSVGPFLSGSVLGLIGLILIAVSKDDFRN